MEAMAGWLLVGGFLVIVVFKVLIIIVVIAVIVVVGFIIWEVVLSCLNSAKKLVSSTSRSVPWVDGERVKINGVGGVALVAAGGGVVGICLVIVRSRARMFRLLGIVAFVVSMFSVLREGGEAEALW